MKVQNLVRLEGRLVLERVSERAWAWKKEVIRFCLLEIDRNLKGLRLSSYRPLDGVSVTEINDILAQSETEQEEKPEQHFHIWFIINSALSKMLKSTWILYFTKSTQQLYPPIISIQIILLLSFGGTFALLLQGTCSLLQLEAWRCRKN